MTSSHSTLKVLSLNICSLRQKLQDLMQLASTCVPNVIAVSETWLDGTITTAEMSIPGYTLHRLDRCGNLGGCVYIH